MDYKSAGVDVEKADKLVDWMKSSSATKGVHSQRVLSGIGGFAALFDGSFSHMKSPVLVSSTDGVGTKLIMALENGQIEGLAQDLVGMCVNDLLCTGAEPLFFLDYFATSSLSEDQLKVFFTNLKTACEESGAALIGGETAELPGLYQYGHFDCAGFSVGVVDKEEIWSPARVKKGDYFVGIASSGFHSNGYSLLRSAFEDDGGEHADAFLIPTKLYWPLVKRIKEGGIDINAACHITGGGLDNLGRVLPSEDLCVEVNAWKWPDIFHVVQKKADIEPIEMLTTFNCGMGFGFILEKGQSEALKTLVAETKGFEVVTDGEIVEDAKAWRLK